MKKKLNKKQAIGLKELLSSAEEEKKRILADYQNLVRRTQEDRVRLIKLANKDLLMSLIQPLEHLEMASQQISDSGLEMVITQFKQNLLEFGLEEIVAMGKDFDLNIMEVVEMAKEGGKSDTGKKVIKVSQKGYRLNGEVIQHAKVVLG